MTKQLNMNSMAVQLIIAGLAGLVDDEGMSPHEAFEVLEAIKRSTFHGLAEMHSENNSKS